MADKAKSQPTSCIVSREKHPLWHYPVFREKNAYPTDEIGCWQQILLFMLEWATFVPQKAKIAQLFKARLLKHSQHLAPWLRKNFSTKKHQKTDETKKTTASIVMFVRMNTEENPDIPYVTNVKGLLQITEFNWQSFFKTGKVLVLYDCACSQWWISGNFTRKLKVQGTLLKLTVYGSNSNQTIDTQIVKLKLTPVRLGSACPSFAVKPYGMKGLNVGTDVIVVESLKVIYPHLEPISLKNYLYGVLEMILDQDMFHSLSPLEYLKTGSGNTPIAIRLQLGWVWKSLLPSTSGLFSTCFTAVTQRDQIKKHRQNP